MIGTETKLDEKLSVRWSQRVIGRILFLAPLLLVVMLRSSPAFAQPESQPSAVATAAAA
jgi:hypothetical protein